MNPHYTIDNNLELRLQEALSKQEKDSAHYLRALLLLPSWRYPFEVQDGLYEARERLKNRTDLLTKHLDLARLEKPNTWPESEQFDNLLSLASLVRLQELSHSDFLDAFLGAVQLSIIDTGGYPTMLSQLKELEWELEIDSEGLHNFIEETKASIAVFQEDIDWAKGSQNIQECIESQFFSHARWQQWTRNASDSLREFFQTMLANSDTVAFASSSSSFAKPLSCHTLWRQEQEELSVTYFAEQFYIQFYGAEKPRLFLDGQDIEACPLPTSLQSSHLCWWPLPNDFVEEIVLQWGNKKKTFFMKSETNIS